MPPACGPGRIWLGVAESNTGPEGMQRLFAASARDAVRSRSLTGKPARMLRTAWTDAWERLDCPGALPMPLQFMATQEARARIMRSDRRDLFGMPVGQIVGSMDHIQSSKQVVLDMVQEYIDTIEGMARDLST